MKLNPYAKAIVAALIAGLAMLEAGMDPVIVDGQVIEAAGELTRTELVRIGSAIAAALGLVWGVPNAVAAAKPTPKPAGDAERSE